jgi:outer membrane protein OmpA-like peptidoglycan-associated protein
MLKPFYAIALLVLTAAAADVELAHAQPAAAASKRWDVNAQIAQLRDRLTDIPIAKVADSVAFRLPTGRVFPAFGHAIFPAAREYLRDVAESLQRHPGTILYIKVHSDNTGTPPSLLALTNARAAALRDYLVARGVEPARIRAEGRGPQIPLGSNDTPDGRELNRRIEFRIVGRTR